MLAFVAQVARAEEENRHIDVQLLLCGARACTFRGRLAPSEMELLEDSLALVLGLPVRAMPT